MEATVYVPVMLLMAMGVALVVAHLTIRNKEVPPNKPATEMESELLPTEPANDDEVEIISPETPVFLTAKAGRKCPHRPPRKATYLYPRRDRVGWGCFRSSSGQQFSARLSDIVGRAA